MKEKFNRTQTYDVTITFTARITARSQSSAENRMMDYVDKLADLMLQNTTVSCVSYTMSPDNPSSVFVSRSGRRSSPMPKFTVRKSIEFSTEIEAATPDEAIEKANGLLDGEWDTEIDGGAEVDPEEFPDDYEEEGE